MRPAPPAVSDGQFSRRVRRRVPVYWTRRVLDPGLAHLKPFADDERTIGAGRGALAIGGDEPVVIPSCLAQQSREGLADGVGRTSGPCALVGA